MLRPAARLDGLQTSMIRRILAEAPAHAVHLGLGQVGSDVAPELRQALAEANATTRARYVPNAGLPALRTAIGALYDAPAEQVIVTVGVQEALALTFLGMVEPGDEVLIPVPTFPVYETLTRIAGGTPVPVPLRAEAGFRPLWEDLEARISARTRLVALASPGNPTGAVADPEEWARIGRGLASAGIPYISDEIYLSWQFVARPHPSMWRHNPAGFVASGLSKSCALAGWRLGWLVCPSEVVGPLTALHQHLVTSAAAPVQEAALVALAHGVPWLHGPFDLPASARTLREVLESTGWVVEGAGGGLYLWARPAGQPAGTVDDLALVRRMMHEAGVVAIPGIAFGDAGRGYVRFSHAVAPEVLEEACRRLRSWAMPAGSAGQPGTTA